MNQAVNEASHEQARQNLEAALDKMWDLRVPTTPENITVWFHYVLADMPQLVGDINRLLSRQVTFDNALCLQLHRRFFTDMDRRRLDLLRDAMRQLILHFSSQLQILDGGVGDYEQALQQCADELAGETDEATLSRLLARVLEETRRAQMVSRAAREKIDRLQVEITQLQASLQQLERSAYEDALTGLANRRAFDQQIAEQLALAASQSQDCSLLLVDVDYFKQFNDRYGHQSGDKALRFIATMLKNLTKGQDLVARYGGEEFAIILPATGYTGAMTLARTIATTIASARLTIDADEQQVDGVTVSIGVGSRCTGDDPDSLLRRTDTCLYKAKSRGRNQVVGEETIVSHD